MNVRIIVFMLILLLSIVNCSESNLNIEYKETVKLDEELEIRAFTEGVYIVTHSFPWEANSMFVVVDSENIVFVDTPYTPEATEKVLNWIKKNIGNHKITAISTGFHFDNLGGNKIFKESGINIYGSDKTVELIKSRGEESRQLFLQWLKGPKMKKYYDRYLTLEYIPPIDLFTLEKGLELNFKNEKIIVDFPGETHSPDNLIVYFKNRKLMFGGCMILAGDKLGNTADANMDEWPDSIKKLKKYEVNMVVPGHGTIFNPDLIDNTLTILNNNKS